VNPAGPRGEFAVFRLTVTADGGYQSEPLEFVVILNPSEVLFVDDDQDNKYRPGDQDPYITEALDQIPGLEYDVWENAAFGAPPEYPNLSQYSIVIWNPYVQHQKDLTDEEEALLSQYLDEGGRLFFNAHEYLYQRFPYGQDTDVIDIPEGTFARDYLHVTRVEHDEYYYHVDPVDGEPLVAGIGPVDLTDFVSSENGCRWWPDDFDLEPSAAPLFTSGDPMSTAFCELPEGETDTIPNGPCALRYPAEGYSDWYKVVFTAFPFEGMPLDARVALLSNVIDWFRTYDATPTPAPTPEPTPGPSPTPGCEQLGVTMVIPATYVSPGDTFYCDAQICNPGADLTAQPFVAMLDVWTGEYWFYPSWVKYPPDFDFVSVDLATGISVVSVLPAFTWPDTGDSSFDGIHLTGALLTPDMTAINGEIGTVTFGYGP